MGWHPALLAPTKLGLGVAGSTVGVLVSRGTWVGWMLALSLHCFFPLAIYD